MAAALKATPEELDGRPLWELLTEADAASLRQRVSKPRATPAGKFLLNFVDAGHSPFTLECRCEVRPDGFLLLGESPDDRAFQEEWLHMNNQLAVLSRENARRGKELEGAKAGLEQALRDLEGSYWHLKKIQEVLPICMDCGRVKAGSRVGRRGPVPQGTRPVPQPRLLPRLSGEGDGQVGHPGRGGAAMTELTEDQRAALAVKLRG